MSKMSKNAYSIQATSFNEEIFNIVKEGNVLKNYSKAGMGLGAAAGGLGGLVSGVTAGRNEEEIGMVGPVGAITGGVSGGAAGGAIGALAGRRPHKLNKQLNRLYDYMGNVRKRVSKDSILRRANEIFDANNPESDVDTLAGLKERIQRNSDIPRLKGKVDESIPKPGSSKYEDPGVSYGEAVRRAFDEKKQNIFDAEELADSKSDEYLKASGRNANLLAAGAGIGGLVGGSYVGRKASQSILDEHRGKSKRRAKRSK